MHGCPYERPGCASCIPRYAPDDRNAARRAPSFDHPLCSRRIAVPKTPKTNSATQRLPRRREGTGQALRARRAPASCREHDAAESAQATPRSISCFKSRGLRQDSPHTQDRNRMGTILNRWVATGRYIRRWAALRPVPPTVRIRASSGAIDRSSLPSTRAVQGASRATPLTDTSTTLRHPNRLSNADSETPEASFDRRSQAGPVRLTIHCTPNRSVHIPKYGPHGAFAIGIRTTPPSLNPANTRSASALSLATIEML
jgi:hypothetical protein